MLNILSTMMDEWSLFFGLIGAADSTIFFGDVVTFDTTFKKNKTSHWLYFQGVTITLRQLFLMMHWYQMKP